MTFQAAQALLASRGIPSTPENVNRALAALQANPELAQRITAGASGRNAGEGGEISTEAPVPAALADPFEQALAQAVNNGQPPTTDSGTPRQAPVSATTQPAPTRISVSETSLDPTSATAPAPAPVQQSDPAFEQAVAEIAAEEGAQDPSGPGATGVSEDSPFPGIGTAAAAAAIASAAAAASGGQEVVPAQGRAVQAGVGRAAPSGTQGALSGPPAALPPQRKLLTAPSGVKEAFTAGGEIGDGIRLDPSDPNFISNVEEDIGKTIDTEDATSKRASPERVKEITRGSRKAVRVTIDKNRYIVYEDGPILNDTTKVIVREQSVLDAVRAFLRAQGSRFATLARIF